MVLVAPALLGLWAFGVEPPESVAEVLAAQEAPAGIYAVLGNHDQWFDAPRVRRAPEAVSIPVLEDQATLIEHGRYSPWHAGVGDWWEGGHDIGGALERIPPGDATLILTHYPDPFPEVPSSVTLTIAGHTHGGQVYIPGVGRPIV